MRVTWIRGLAVAFFAGFGAHCGDPQEAECTAGQEGCGCFNGISCYAGLECLSGICVNPNSPSTSPTGPDPTGGPETTGGADTTTGEDTTGGPGTTNTTNTTNTTATTNTTNTTNTTEPMTTGPGVQCGDGQVEGDEDCDDGNLTPNDACDNDCEFTPIGLQVGESSETVEMGHDNWEKFTQVCPDGTVIQSISTRRSWWISAVKATCAKPKLEKVGEQGITVVFEPTGQELPWEGNVPNDNWFEEATRSCPEGHALVGLKGRAAFPDSIPDSIAMLCAPLKVEKSGGLYQLVFGAAVEQPMQGDPEADVVLDAKPLCPANRVGTGLFGHRPAGYELNGLGMTCAPIELTWP